MSVVERRGHTNRNDQIAVLKKLKMSTFFSSSLWRNCFKDFTLGSRYRAVSVTGPKSMPDNEYGSIMDTVSIIGT